MTEVFAWANEYPYLTFFAFCIACVCIASGVAGLGQLGTKHYHVAGGGRPEGKGERDKRPSEQAKIGSDHERPRADPHPLGGDRKD